MINIYTEKQNIFPMFLFLLTNGYRMFMFRGQNNFTPLGVAMSVKIWVTYPIETPTDNPYKLNKFSIYENNMKNKIKENME